MPLYEYRCDSCGQVFEVMQKFSDDPLTVHESCGGSLERLISTPAFQFKGSGWYVTDYGRANSGKSNGDAGGKAETKTEAKPESKTESKDSTTKTTAKNEK